MPQIPDSLEAKSVLTTFLETSPAAKRTLGKARGGIGHRAGSSFFFVLTRSVLNQLVFPRSQVEHN